MRVREKLIEEGRMGENKGSLEAEKLRQEFLLKDQAYNDQMKDVMKKVDEKGYLVEDSKFIENFYLTSKRGTQVR
jgi:hypothetical protein